ncbi:MAG: response regulator transcription factor [Sphingomonadaceae bacterium]|nr:response regulator transcription factor [Sphingomonadaceae bacterium]
MRIAIVDDEPSISGPMAQALSSAGMACETFPDGGAARRALQRETFDVMLVDWNMPGMSGIELVSWAMESMEAPPGFIMLTGRSDPDDIVHALETGASDYIVKPGEPAVVIARVKAVARRGQPPVPERQESFGPFLFDNLDRTVSVSGEAVKLTAKEFELALAFFKNLNRPLSRQYLLSEVWGSSEGVETRTLDMHVSRIRSKLGLRPEQGFVIQSVFGFGYRLETFDTAED